MRLPFLFVVLAAFALPASAEDLGATAANVRRMAAELDDPDEWPESDAARTAALGDAALVAPAGLTPKQTLALLELVAHARRRLDQAPAALAAYRAARDLPGADPALAASVAWRDGTLDAMGPAEQFDYLRRLAEQSRVPRRAAALYGACGFLALTAGRLDDAGRLAAAGLASDPDGDLPTLVAAGHLLLTARPAGGLRAVDEYFRRCPNRPDLQDLYNVRGNILIDMRRPAGAAASLNRSLAQADATLRPARRAQDFVHLALTHLALGRPGNAAYAAKWAAVHAPGAESPYRVAAAAEAAAGDLPEALALIDHALRLEATAAGHALRGDILLAAGRPADARRAYDAALRADPDSRRGNLGRLWQRVAAAEDPRLALSESQNFANGPGLDVPVWRTLRARGYLSLDDADAALRELDAADAAVSSAKPDPLDQYFAKASADTTAVRAAARGRKPPPPPPSELLWLLP